MMAICFALNTNETGVPHPPPPTPKPGLGTPPPPGDFGWKLAFDPGKVVNDDNYWQLWRNESGSRYALCFRGTTSALSSIWEDLKVRARGPALRVRGVSVPLAVHPMARVHGGFAEALEAMLEDSVLEVLTRFAREGMEQLYLIGHSQGAAIATLCRSFLEYQKLEPALGALETKTYAFAQPKPGNRHYAYDFELVTGRAGPAAATAFRVANDQDWVPQVPLSIELPSDLTPPNPTTIPTPFHSRILHWLLKLLRGPKWRQGYAPAGVPVILAGVPGPNPEAADDFLWQHHGEQYYDLIVRQFDLG